ncbi:MAG: anaerobic ribonucleoside-triphosphate reductase, partial [Thermoproteota archaeon]
MKTELDLNDGVVALEKAYYDRIDWEVQENANIDISYGGFVKFLLDKLLKKESLLLEYLPEKAVRMHFEGDIHIHKLPHSLYLPYCTGWSYKKLLLSGLVTPTMVSRPPKHADTAVSQLVSFFCTAAQEWTGAQAVSAFDLYLGAFVKHDKPSPKAVKQMLQRMLFDLNYPTRIGFQSAFTNITVLLDTNKQFLQEDAVVGGKIVGKLGDYLDEAVLVAKELFSLLIEGDALGQPFSFPIPTLMVTKDFDWEGSKWDGLTDLIFEALSKRGSAYLLNGNAAEVESLFSMCCRLTLDMEKVMNFELNSILEDVEEELRKSRGARGLWAVPDATGSIGVVTINLPRIGALSRGEW